MTPTLTIASKLAEALEYASGTYTIKDVLDAIECGKMQLWVEEGDEDSLIVTEIHQYPRRRALQFFLAAGTLDGVKALRDRALAWGKEEGCDMALAVARFGWERTLMSPDEGWSVKTKVYEKDLAIGMEASVAGGIPVLRSLKALTGQKFDNPSEARTWFNDNKKNKEAWKDFE